jgi:hypothetical protein
MEKGEGRKKGGRGIKIMEKLEEKKNSKKSRRKKKTVMVKRRMHLPDVSCLNEPWFI